MISDHVHVNLYSRVDIKHGFISAIRPLYPNVPGTATGQSGVTMKWQSPGSHFSIFTNC